MKEKDSLFKIPSQIPYVGLEGWKFVYNYLPVVGLIGFKIKVRLAIFKFCWNIPDSKDKFINLVSVVIRWFEHWFSNQTDKPFTSHEVLFGSLCITRATSFSSTGITPWSQVYHQQFDGTGCLIGTAKGWDAVGSWDAAKKDFKSLSHRKRIFNEASIYYNWISAFSLGAFCRFWKLLLSKFFMKSVFFFQCHGSSV